MWSASSYCGRTYDCLSRAVPRIHFAILLGRRSRSRVPYPFPGSVEEGGGGGGGGEAVFTNAAPAFSSSDDHGQGLGSLQSSSLSTRQRCRSTSFSACPFIFHLDRLAVLVVKASASGAEDPGFKSRLRQDFSGSSHTSDFSN